jgi:hypothetical protein
MYRDKIGSNMDAQWNSWVSDRTANLEEWRRIEPILEKNGLRAAMLACGRWGGYDEEGSIAKWIEFWQEEASINPSGHSLIPIHKYAPPKEASQCTLEELKNAPAYIILGEWKKIKYTLYKHGLWAAMVACPWLKDLDEETRVTKLIVWWQEQASRGCIGDREIPIKYHLPAKKP